MPLNIITDFLAISQTTILSGDIDLWMLISNMIAYHKHIVISYIINDDNYITIKMA